MVMNPNKAQDVWKDAGEHVQFTVLELKRENQAKEQEAVQEFVERFQAITPVSYTHLTLPTTHTV